MVPYMTSEMFALMEESVAKECKDLDELTTGVSVVLWRLRELLAGYRYALDHGYENYVYAERETNP